MLNFTDIYFTSEIELIKHLSPQHQSRHFCGQTGKKPVLLEKTHLSELATTNHLMCWHLGSNQYHSGEQKEH